MKKLYNKMFKSCTNLAGVLLLVFGANGVALAQCIGDINASGTILVDATTSCAAIGLDGCRVDSDTGCCTMANSDTEVCVQRADPNDKFSGVTWATNGGTEFVNWGLFGGSVSGGACGNIWDPGVRVPTPGSVFGSVKSNGSIQAVTYAEFCTNHETPVASISLTKRVVAEDPDTAGLFDCTQAAKVLDLEITEPVKIKYCYTIRNDGAAAYANIALHDDMGTLGDPADDLTENLGPLPERGPSGEITFESPTPIEFAQATVVVNTATASGTDANGEFAQDVDTARLNIELVPVDCDVLTVVDSNGNQIQNSFLSFTGFNPANPSTPAVCVKTGDATTFPRTRRNRCIDDCTLKPECVPPAVGSTAPGGICEQPCLPTGAWTEHDTAANSYACIGPAQNVPSNVFPNCLEIQQDLNRDCTLNAVHPMPGQESYGEQTSTNPYVYKQCRKQGGRKVCEVYCYLYDGEDASVCPDTSIVIPPS